MNKEFKVFAPNAKQVLLKIENIEYLMEKRNGFWFADLECNIGEKYQYIIDGKIKTDLYANQVNKDGIPIIFKSFYEWKKPNFRAINFANIYEVYLPDVEGNTYQKKAKSILKDAKDFTHVQIMPFNYTPNNKTLGYKTSNYFAPNPEYGNLDDLKEMVDMFHQEGLAVIFDFCIFEFEEYTEEGFHNYDGTPLYEFNDNRQHSIFTGYLFDHSKNHVKEILKDIVNFMIIDLHGDGIRIDGVNEVLFNLNENGVEQEVDEKGLRFIQDLISIIPEEKVIVADLLTHKKIDDLGLRRINRIEGNMFMFQLQNILLKGKEWYEQNKEFESNLLMKTLEMMQVNRSITTINHDIHIDGMVGKIENGHFKSKEIFDFFKKILYAMPSYRQIYMDAELDKDFIELINKIIGFEFRFGITKDNQLVYFYRKEKEEYTLFFDLFNNKIVLKESKIIIL